MRVYAVVKANHGNIFRNADSTLCKHSNYSHSNCVVAGRNCCVFLGGKENFNRDFPSSFKVIITHRDKGIILVKGNVGTTNRSLELATQIYKQKVNVTRAEHLPSIALMGNYMVTNPSVFNSFENKFKGMWNVGVMVQLPIWHWGEGIYKTKAAKAEARIAQYQLQDAREKIELQVNQAAFKVNEAGKKLVMASKNMEKAEENLRYATLGFREGVIATSNVLEAQTAWLSAQSEKIDAQIDVKLTEIYLKKSLGTLQ